MFHIFLCLLIAAEVNGKVFPHRVFFLCTECLYRIYLLWKWCYL